MALGVLLLLAAFGGVLRVLTHSAYREVDLVNAHMQAIAVGEIGYATVMARLTGTPWSDRWFRAGPDVQRDVAAAGGTYTLMIRTTPQPVVPDDPLRRATLGSLNQADLLIRATFDRSSVLMFWRLTVPDDALDALARVIPVHFTFGPDALPAAPATADAIAGQVADAIRERDANTPRVEEIHRPLQEAGGAQGIGGVLGIPVDPGVVDGPPSVKPPTDLPVFPAIPLPAASLTGTWESPPLVRRIAGVDRTFHDYLQIEQVGNRVSGRCVCRDASGFVLATWDFSTTLEGSFLRFNAENFVSAEPADRFRKDLGVDAAAGEMRGVTILEDGSNHPAGYTKLP